MLLHLAACSSVGAWLITDQGGVPVTDSVYCALAHNCWPIQGLHNLLKGAFLQAWALRAQQCLEECYVDLASAHYILRLSTIALRTTICCFEPLKILLCQA